MQYYFLFVGKLIHPTSLKGTVNPICVVPVLELGGGCFRMGGEQGDETQTGDNRNTSHVIVNSGVQSLLFL